MMLKRYLTFLYRVFILAKTWGIFKILLFIPYEIFYMCKFRTNTLFSINHEELDVDNYQKRNSTEYFPTPYYIILKVFSLIEKNLHNSIFIDFGSGAGRVLTFVSIFKPKKIIGIEFSKNLHSLAKKNLMMCFKRCSNIDWELFHINALNYKIPKDSNVFFFYDPFNENIMIKIIKKIKFSLDKNLRQIFIIYISPQHKSIFLKFGFRLIHSEINNYNKGFAIFKYH